MKKSYAFYLALSLSVILMSCDEIDTNNLDVDNLNEPVFNIDASEYPAIVNGSYLKFWQSIQLSTPSYPVSVMAQGGTSSWGGWGTRDVGTIPRKHIDNSSTYNNKGLYLNSWLGLYGAINPVNDVLKFITQDDKIVLDNNGIDITQEVIANGKAIQGLVLGYLSLLYDQAFIADENTDLGDQIFLSDYKEVNEIAISKLEEAIQLFENSDNQMTGWNGLVYVGNDAASLLRGFVAKFEVTKARSNAEVSETDWNKVLSSTSGQLVDLAPQGDAQVWWSRMLIHGQWPQRYRVSQKVIRMMNMSKSMEEVPYPWPDQVATMPEISTPDDQRMNSDLTYNSSVSFVGARGYYFFSNYHYSRYESFLDNGLLEPMDFLRIEEIELLRAEALIRTSGDKALAAQIINKTRVVRGGLTPLTGGEPNEVLLEAVAYERIIEFTWEGSCNIWFYRRMITPPNNMDSENLYFLEPRTARHFPVPAEELAVLGMQVYTFGGDIAEQ